MKKVKAHYFASLILLFFCSSYLFWTCKKDPAPEPIPEPWEGGIELPPRSVIAVDFSPMSGSWLYGGLQGDYSLTGRVNAYKNIIAGMVDLGVNALMDDAFDEQRDKDNMAAIAQAVREYNQEHDAKFSWFILAEPFNSSTGVFDNFWGVEALKQYGHGPDYATKNGKPIFAVWNGGASQATAGQYINDLLTPLKSAGFDPYFLYESGLYPNTIANNVRIMRQAGYDVNFYVFGTDSSQANIDRTLTLQDAMGQYGATVFPGVSPAYWQVCGRDRSNYIEHEGSKGLFRFWNALLPPNGVLKDKDMVFLTEYSDLSEDHHLVPQVQIPPAPYGGSVAYVVPGGFNGNTDMPIWTHRGFREAQKRLIKSYRLGEVQPIVKDKIFYSYRQHPKDLPAPTGCECVEAGTPITGIENAKDEVYLTTELTAPATLTVNLGGVQIGSWDLNAGVSHVEAPWGANRGQPQIILTRAGETVLSATGALSITNTPLAYDGEGTRNFGTYADFVEGN